MEVTDDSRAAFHRADHFQQMAFDEGPAKTVPGIGQAIFGNHNRKTVTPQTEQGLVKASGVNFPIRFGQSRMPAVMPCETRLAEKTRKLMSCVTNVFPTIVIDADEIETRFKKQLFEEKPREK